MRVKKSHLILAALLLGLVFVAILGFNTWNAQIIGNLAKLNQFSLYLILGFAFFAGAVSFFSPCGLALLPAFVSYNLVMIDGGRAVHSKGRVLKIGLFSALGIITFYVILGVLFSLLGAVIAPYVQVVQYIIAFLFIAFGILLLKKFTLTSTFFDKFRQKVHANAMQRKGYKGFYIFGLLTGWTSLDACSLSFLHSS